MTVEKTSFDCANPEPPATTYTGLVQTLDNISKRISDLTGTRIAVSHYAPSYKKCMEAIQDNQRPDNPYLAVEKIETEKLFGPVRREKRTRVLIVYFNFLADPFGEIRFKIEEIAPEIERVIREELANFQKTFRTTCLELQKIFTFPRH